MIPISFSPQIKFPILKGIPIVMSNPCPKLSRLLNRGIKRYACNNYKRKKYNHTYYKLMYTKYKPS